MAPPVRVIFFDLGDTLVRGTTWLPGAKAAVTALAAGFRLGIVSNTGNLASRADILALLPPDFDPTMFEAGLVMFSSEIGVEKPHPGIFEAAVAAAGVPAGECLYVSENPVETLAAERVGLRSLRVVTKSNDLTRLRSYLIDSSIDP